MRERNATIERNLKETERKEAEERVLQGGQEAQRQSEEEHPSIPENESPDFSLKTPSNSDTGVIETEHRNALLDLPPYVPKGFSL